MAAKTDFPGVALVIGLTSGIGFAVASAFAKAGCNRILLVDLNLSGLTSVEPTPTTSHPNLKTLCLQVDISVEGAMEEALETAMKTPDFGRLDYAVNCAGMNGVNANHAPTISTETSVEYVDKINGNNNRGTWMANRAFLKIMMAQELSKAEDEEMVGREQRGVSSIFQADWASLGCLRIIRDNCVYPGLIDTPITKAMGDENAMKLVVDSIPLKRMGKASEIADCCLFLSSTKASWIQGQSIAADGGIALM